jgi:streptogramin lyase
MQSRTALLVSATLLTFLLTGCTLANTATDAPIPGAALQGKVYGGNQPVVGAHVYLMAATVSGVGAAGYGLASTSLLSAALTHNSDPVGAYVLTDSSGGFSLDTVSGATTYFYTCPSSTTQVYLYVLGGNPGAGTNSAASFMAALGSCGNLSSSTNVLVNELTTVAAAYALSGFATDALHVSIPKYVNTTQQTNSITDALAQTDLQNAFANANNLVNISTGVAQTTTSSGGTPVTAQVITLGNILAACVNASNTAPANCTTLFSNALSGGSTGSTPTETATAAINIAHNPYVSSTVMTNLYGLQAASGAPFAGGQTAQPTDFTVSITFPVAANPHPFSIAIDGSGSAWVANYNTSTLSKFSSSGTVLSGSGYTGGGLSSPSSIAIDGSGNAWVANVGGSSSISEFSSSGAALTTPITSPYTGGGLNTPQGIAITGSGSAWLANNGANVISQFSSTGTDLSSGSGYTGGGLNSPRAIAIDGSGYVWVANNSGNSLSKFSSSGTAVTTPNASPFSGGGLSSPTSIAIDGSGNVWAADSSNGISKFSSSGTDTSSGSGYSGGGLNNPQSIAIDGSGNAWVANFTNSSVSQFSSAGTALSPSSGYTGGGVSSPRGIAIDGSGNVWTANYGGNSITELVGAATPVVTPVVASLIAPYSAPASKP